MFFILYAFIFKGCTIRRRRKFWWFHVVLQKTAKKYTRLKTHVLNYCPAHEISFFFLPRPRCRRDLRESPSYKTSRTPQGGNISFLPLISLSMRCMHNEVCGCTEILLLSVAGKSRSSRKFPAFLSLMQTKVTTFFNQTMVKKGTLRAKFTCDTDSNANHVPKKTHEWTCDIQTHCLTLGCALRFEVCTWVNTTSNLRDNARWKWFMFKARWRLSFTVVSGKHWQRVSCTVACAHSTHATLCDERCTDY